VEMTMTSRSINEILINNCNYHNKEVNKGLEQISLPIVQQRSK
jgi:hypothetical protein